MPIASAAEYAGNMFFAEADFMNLKKINTLFIILFD